MSDNALSSHAPRSTNRGPRLPWRPLAFVVLFVAVLAVVLIYRDELRAGPLVEHARQLEEYASEHPLRVPATIFAVCALSSGLSIPPLVVLATLSGWLMGRNSWLGMCEAVLLASFASTLGSTLVFFTSRYLLRGWIEGRWWSHIQRADELVERDGAFYVMSLRLVHVIPSWMINLVMGCTRIRVTTFWWATQLGTLPATLLYVYTGAHLPKLEQLESEGVSSVLTPPIIGAFVLMALIPLALRQAIHRYGRAKY